MRFSRAHITLGTSAALILGLPTYLYADQHFGPPAGEPMGLFTRPHAKAPYTASGRTVKEVRQQGGGLHQSGHVSLRHDNGATSEVDFDLHQLGQGKGREDVSVDCTEKGVKSSHTIDSDTGEFTMAEGSSRVVIQLKPDGKMSFNGKEYAENDRALVDAVRKTGRLSKLNWSHYACAHEELEHFGSSATTKSSSTVKTIGNVAGPALSILAMCL